MTPPEYRGAERSWEEGGKLLCEKCYRLATHVAQSYFEVDQHTMHTRDVYLCEPHLNDAIKKKIQLYNGRPLPEYRRHLRSLQQFIAEGDAGEQQRLVI